MKSLRKINCFWIPYTSQGMLKNNKGIIMKIHLGLENDCENKINIIPSK